MNNRLILDSHVLNFSVRVYASPELYSQLRALRRFLTPSVQHDPFVRAMGGMQHRDAAYDEILQVISNRSALLLDARQPLLKNTAALIPWTVIWLDLPALVCIAALALLIRKAHLQRVGGTQEYEMQPFNQPLLSDLQLYSANVTDTQNEGNLKNRSPPR